MAHDPVLQSACDALLNARDIFMSANRTGCLDTDREVRKGIDSR